MAKEKNKSLFSNIVGDLKDNKNQKSKREIKPKYLEERKTRISEIKSGDIEEKTFRLVDPDRCKMWENHNRAYNLLNEGRCKDLIDGFKAQGRQEFPAIVRICNDDKDYDFEVICGARRHWTVSYLRSNNYTNFKFLVEIRSLNDEEAFRLSDVENRDKEDISDYERSLDYQKALRKYYRSQKDMAKRMEVSESWLSRYLKLADLPKQIVNCFFDITEIKEKPLRSVIQLLKDDQKKQGLIKNAEMIVFEQNKFREEGVEPYASLEVVKKLKELNPPKEKASTLEKPKKYVIPESKKTQFTILEKPSGGVSINLSKIDGKNKSQVKDMLFKELESIFSKA